MASKILKRQLLMIEVPSIIESAKDVYNIPVKVSKDAIVTLGDIATIKEHLKILHLMQE